MNKYGIIGFGGLGKKHLCNLVEIGRKRRDIELAAICGTTRERAKDGVRLNLGTVDMSSIDFTNVNFYDDYKDMLENEELDFVINVTPTFLHEEISVYALNKGVHVFSEKPMALSYEGCEKMLKAAKDNKRKLLIGQCLRFAKVYIRLKEYIDSKRFGKVRSAVFERYSQLPLWSWDNWILDPKKSGGAVLDLHIHDVDLINWFFGTPKSVISHSTNYTSELESMRTEYFYDDLVVSALADWSLPQTFPFTARCRIDFETASITVENNILTVYTDDESYYETFNDGVYFKKEMEEFLKLVIDKQACLYTSADDSAESIRIAMAEIDSAYNKKEIYL